VYRISGCEPKVSGAKKGPALTQRAAYASQNSPAQMMPLPYKTRQRASLALEARKPSGNRGWAAFRTP
jgi:hypothetical protein